MNQDANAKPIVWWILWVSFLGGVFVMYYLLGSKSREAGHIASGSLWLAGALPAVAGICLRWIVLPRVSAAATALPLFLVGIALCEASLFLGLFIFPEQKLALFIASVVGIIQFAPYFASQYDR